MPENQENLHLHRGFILFDVSEQDLRQNALFNGAHASIELEVVAHVVKHAIELSTRKPDWTIASRLLSALQHVERASDRDEMATDRVTDR